MWGRLPIYCGCLITCAGQIRPRNFFAPFRHALLGNRWQLSWLREYTFLPKKRGRKGSLTLSFFYVLCLCSPLLFWILYFLPKLFLKQSRIYSSKLSPNATLLQHLQLHLQLSFAFFISCLHTVRWFLFNHLFIHFIQTNADTWLLRGCGISDS